MNIVCGTDLSADARQAAEIAGALAARTGGTLLLVHGLELPSIAHVAGDVVLFPATLSESDMARAGVAESLQVEALRVAGISGAVVEPRVEIGAGDAVVLDAASRAKAGLIVVGTHGRHAPVRWLVGSTAERLAATSPLPLLVTRGSSAPLQEWAKGARALRVLLAADFEESFLPAARFASALFGDRGDVEIHVAHACDLPLAEVGRLAYVPPLPFRRADLEANARAELRRHAQAAGLEPRADTTHLVWGKAAAALATFAREGRFDVLVAGTHGRRGLDRALLGSVATGLLRRSTMPVLVVPFERTHVRSG